MRTPVPSAPGLRLEILGPHHAEEMFEGLSDPGGYVFLPSDPPPDIESLRARYARLAIGRSADGSEIWLNWIIRRQDDGRPLGYVQATVQGTATLIAYHVFPRYWRRGVASAAGG